MKAKLSFGIVAGSLLMASVMAPALGAEKTVNEKGRTVYHFTKVETMQVGDLTGHVVGVVDASGLSFPDRNEIGVYSSKIMFDVTNGTGTHQSYGVTTFEDKATTVTLNKGVTTAHPDGTSGFEGTFSYIGGTGRFAGIKGGGTYTGRRMAPLSPGSGAEAYSDYTSTYTLPDR